MKRLISLTLTLILTLTLCIPTLAYEFEDGLPVPEFKGAVVDVEDKVELVGYSEGAELLQNSIFTDTKDHWANKPITRMSAQSVIKGYGEQKFRPNKFISRQEVIASLVRMKGLEGTIQENLSAQGAGLTGEVINDVWAEGYIIEAGNLGILTGNEDGNFKSNTTREEVALWVARLLELEPVYDNIEILYTFDDWREISFENIGLIEAVLQERIMNGDTKGNFNPKSDINRAEVASILNNISDRLYQERKLESFYGQVINIQKKNTNDIGYSVQETIATIRNIDGTITSITAKNTAKEALNEFVVYKKGIVDGSKSLSIGDEVEYIVKDDEEVIYVEAYNDGSILQKIKENSMQGSKLRTYFGRVAGISTENYLTMDSNKSLERFRVKNIDGQAFDIVVETDKNTGIKNDIIVYRNGDVGGSHLLELDDDIEYIVRDNKNIVYVNVVSFAKQVIGGTVHNVNTSENKITIVDYDDETKVFGVVPYAAVTVNLRPAALSDLKYGQEVTLNINNGLVTSITGETFLDEPGYIPRDGKARTGKIKFLSSDTLTLEYSDKTSQTFNIYDDTIILKEDRSIRFKDLREGDKIKILFDDIYSSDIDKIEVEGNEQLVKEVYKGKLTKVDVGDDEITLTNTHILRNRQWMKEAGIKDVIKLNEGVDIYYKGRLMDLEELKDDYINETLYVAIEDAYGKDKAVKVVIKPGSEKLYSDDIEDINSSLYILELENGRNIAYDEGTIIVKDNRLLSMDSLEEDINALVVSSYSNGNYDANVIKLGKRAFNILNNIYVGKLESIDREDFEVTYYSELEDHEWDDVDRDSLTFEYRDDSYIIELLGNNFYYERTSEDFFNNGYSEEDNEDYYTFMVTDDDGEVIGMTLRQDELFDGTGISSRNAIENKIQSDLKVTTGSVAEVDEYFERIEIYDPYDWSSNLNEWIANTSNVYVDIDQTLLIKEGEIISMEDIEEDDIIYVVRDGADAIIILVE